MSETKRIKGIVARIVKSRYGYGVVLQNKDGYYYNTKYQPKFNEGDEVGIEFSPKGETSAQITKVQVLREGVGAPAPRRSAGSGASYASGDKQDSIVWQHSQEMATRILGKAEDVESYLPLFDDLTARLFEDALNPRDSDAYKTYKARAADVASGQDTTWDVDAGGDDPSSGDDWDEWPTEL